MNPYIYAGIHDGARLSFLRQELVLLNGKDVTYSDLTEVLKECAKVTGVELSQVMSKTRLREVIDAKRLFIYLAKNYFKLTYNDIAMFLGMENHATALHHDKKFKGFLETNDIETYEYLRTAKFNTTEIMKKYM